MSGWDPEDLEARLMPEQLRLGLARGACLLAVDRLLAVQLDQFDDLDRDDDDEDRDPFTVHDPDPPTADPARLESILRRMRLHEILNESDCQVVRRLRVRAADVVMRLPDLLLGSGDVHDADLLLGAREVIARAGGYMARLHASADPAYDDVDLDDAQAQSGLALFAGQLIDAVDPMGGAGP